MEALGILPQTKQTWRHKPIRELFAEILARHPEHAQNSLRRIFRKEALADEEYLDAIIDYAFDAAWRAHERQLQSKPISAKQKAENAKRRAAELEAHAEQVKFIKEKVILLNQEMPNGMRARSCTLDYMYRLGGAYRRVGQRGSRKLVGTVYDELSYREKLKDVF